MKYISFLLILFCTLSAHAQKEQPLIKPARVIFYNTENLFDTINDPTINDEEFLPTSKLHWNTEKYKLKLKHISQALAGMLTKTQPLIIGLSEIENRKVLQDLIAQPALKRFHLGIIHHDSPDERGIDVALLYNKNLIEQPFDAFLRVEFPFDTADRTRDIVYIKCYVNEDEPLWIFVNHWSSRWGGKEQSERKRLVEEKLLKDKIDNIFIGEPSARVIVMGDLNDNPVDSAVQKLCANTNDSIPDEEKLVDLMSPLYKQGIFTLKYKEENEVFDQFIVSKNLLNNQNSYHVGLSGAHIFKPDWLLFKNSKYGIVPNRTYFFNHWVKGYSDHLPVYFDIVFR